MVIYIVCYSLQERHEDQSDQIGFWFKFLNSSLPPSPVASSVPRWKIITVGLRADVKHDTSHLSKSNLFDWQNTFPRLPLFKGELFLTSAKDSQGIPNIEHLLDTVKEECAKMFSCHSVRIPSSYQKLLSSIKSLSSSQHFIAVTSLHKNNKDMEEGVFQRALNYLHAIGHIIKLDDKTVCLDVATVPKVAAKFISPESIRTQHFLKEDITLLKLGYIGDVLQLRGEQYVHLTNLIATYILFSLKSEIALMLKMETCYELPSQSSDEIYYLFPSLASPARKFYCLFISTYLILFTIENIKFKNYDKLSVEVAGVRFLAPKGMVFVTGFFYQFIVTICVKLIVSSSLYFIVVIALMELIYIKKTY